MINNYRNIAVIGFNTLIESAIKTIILQCSNINCQCMKNISMHSDLSSAYIITPNVLIDNIDFFIPRKNRLLVISESENTVVSTESSIKIISAYNDYNLIVDAIKTLIISTEDLKIKNHELSSREIEVLKEIASGKIIKEIADSLNISVNTVLTHRKNISSKLGIRSVSGLSLYAMMNGIIK